MPIKRLSVSKRLLLTLIAGLTASANLLALGVGQIKLESTLGYPLLATVQLHNIDALNKEEVRINQAPLHVYEQMGIDRSALYKTLLFNIDDNKVVTITSKEPVKEPYLHFIIQFRWPQGELLREVKLLIDPPH